MPIDDLLDRLERAEKGFTGSTFFAPVLRGRVVSVRLAGVVCALRVSEGLPRGFTGWAVLRALSTSRAAFLRPATLAERAAYLALFPSVRMILLHAEQGVWLALPAQSGDRRFRIRGVTSVLLAEEGPQRFDTVITRFDGQRFWFDRPCPTHDPALAAFLREQFARLVGKDQLPPPPSALRKKGLTAEERAAYALLRQSLSEARRSDAEFQLADALAHAGANLLSYVERDGLYAVTYTVDGRQHTSLVRPGDLTVQTAGICLSGQDEFFDLASLVSVLREENARDGMLPIDIDALYEEALFRIPPRQAPPHDTPEA
jgi:hypothetical protein